LQPLIRRVRRSEYSKLLEFCKNESQKSGAFQNHEGWLKNAVKELQYPDSKRVVFSAQVDTYTGPKIVGCIFLKKSNYNDSVEMKNLLVSSENPNRNTFEVAYKTEIKKLLVNKSIKFCAIREFLKIEIELLQEEMRQDIQLFLELEFRVISIREKYLPGKIVCLLEKSINDTYQADPLSYTKLMRWFIRTILPAEINRPIENYFEEQSISALTTSIRFKKQEMYFKKEINESEEQFLTLTQEKQSSIQKVTSISSLEGELILLQDDNESYLKDQAISNESEILEKVSNNIIQAYSPSSKLRLLLGKKKLIEPLTDILVKYNIHSIYQEELFLTAGGKKSSLRIPFSEEEVGGVITVLEENTFNGLSAVDDFTYFLISGIGEGLIKEQNGDDKVLLIFCPHLKRKDHGAFVGYAKIEEIQIKPFERAYDSFPGTFKALDNEDLELYRASSGKFDSQVKALLCSKLKAFNNPIEVATLDDACNYNNYYHDELYQNLSSSVYLSNSAKKHILKTEAKETLQETELIFSDLIVTENKEFDRIITTELIELSNLNKQKIKLNIEVEFIDSQTEKSIAFKKLEELNIKIASSKHYLSNLINKQNDYKLEVKIDKALERLDTLTIQQDTLIKFFAQELPSHIKNIITKHLMKHEQNVRNELIKLRKIVLKISPEEKQTFIDTIDYDKLSNSLVDIKDLLQESNLSISDRFILTIPIIPYILKYETSLKPKFPKKWEEHIKKLRKIIL